MDEKVIKENLGKAFPSPIGLVITKNQGKINICPVNFQVISTFYEQPYTACIGLSNTNQTLKNILGTGEFVYAYPTKKHLKDAIYCGSVSGKNIDKVKNTKFEFENSKSVTPPNLKNAIINFECKIAHTIDRKGFTIIIADILEMNSSTKENLEKIYTFGKQRYGIIKEIEILHEGR